MRDPPEDFEEFVARLRKISELGFVETHRNADTGVGKTLEDLLGIEENNIPGPDAVGVELKTVRRNSSSLTTLFTKEPPRGTSSRPFWGQQMVRELGYTDDKGRPALKVTIEPEEPNNQGFYLNYTEQQVEIAHIDKGPCGIYPLDFLQEVFESKFPELVMVFADTREKDGREYFHYNKAYHLDGFDSDAFLALMREGIITVDLRMHLKESGANRNHGTAWRINEEHQLDRAFDQRTSLLDKTDIEEVQFRSQSAQDPEQDTLDDWL